MIFADNPPSGDVLSPTPSDLLDTDYYRYYAFSSTFRHAGGLSYVFGKDPYARLTAAFPNPEAASDSQVAPYADHHFRYDPTSKRVTRHDVQGAGGGNGLSAYTYAYYTSPTNPTGYNSWKYKTTETLPDGNQNIRGKSYGDILVFRIPQQATQTRRAGAPARRRGSLIGAPGLCRG